MNALCWHTNQTTPRRDEQGEYCRCLDCGGRLPWSWSKDVSVYPLMPVRPRIRYALGRLAGAPNALRSFIAEKRVALKPGVARG